MKFIFCLFFFWSAIFAIVYGGVSFEHTDDPDENAGNCLSKNPDVGILKVGEEKRLEKSCVKASCGRDDKLKKGVITLSGCGAVHAVPPCRVTEGNLYDPYPKCCPQLKCE